MNDERVYLRAHPYWYIVNNYAADTVTITVTPASGWKIYRSIGYSMQTGEAIRIKSGKRCKLPKGESVGFHFTLKKTRTGDVIDYTVNVMR